MLKAIKDELKGGWQFPALALGIGWGTGLVMTLIYSLVWKGNPGPGEEWSGVGSTVGLVAALFTLWLCTLVQFSTSFALAVTMGRTRRRYVGSALCANLLLGLLVTLAMYPLVWLEEALHRGWAPALPYEGGTVYTAYPVRWLFEQKFWMVLLLVVTAVTLGMLIGALLWRVGQWGFWVIWAVCVGSGGVVGYLSRIKSGPFLLLRQMLQQWAAGMTAPMWVALWAAACLVLLAASWLLVRRAPVK